MPLFTCRVAFQLPLLFWLQAYRPGILRLVKAQPQVCPSGHSVLAALITLPDVISQMAMVVPLLFLYELGIFMVVMSERRRMRESRVEGQVGL